MSDWNKIRGAVVGATLAAVGAPELGYAYWQGEENKRQQKKAEQRQFDYQLQYNEPSD